jgi:tetratricopeptide (TPR) repeat protein
MPSIRSFTPLALLRLLPVTCALTATLFAVSVHAGDIDDVNQLLKAGKQAQALTKVEQSLTTKPRDPQLRFLKGVIQTEMGKPQDAIGTFNKLTEEYPELPEPYNNLAVLHASAGQFDKARAALEMAIRTNPSYSTAHENLGDIYANLASQAYSKALQLGGSSTSLQPKLTLIRELFAPGGKGVNPSAAKPVATSDKNIDTPKNLPRKAWEEERRDHIMGKSRISVEVSEIATKSNGNTATVKFRQTYDADALSTSSRKTS